MWAFLKKSIKAIAYFVWRLGPRLMSLAFVVSLIFLIMFAVLDTRRDVAYRYSAQDSAECTTRLAPANSTILASDKINNDERRAIDRSNRTIPIAITRSPACCSFMR